MSEHMTVVIGTIGKAHGLRGEVSFLLRTDVPELRLQPGARVSIDDAQLEDSRAEPRFLTIASTRVHQGRWYVRFAEVTTRTAAENLRGVSLTLTVDRDEEFEQDPDAWYPEELRGMSVRDRHGRTLGQVIDLEHYPAHDQLIVRAVSGARVMLPFVEQLVPQVDLESGVIVADPPGGLFDEVGESEEGDAGGPEAPNHERRSPDED